MKKVLSLAVALVVTVMLGSSIFAAIETKTVTAKADFTNSGQADFSFTIKKVSDDSVATEITWTSPDAFVVGGTTTWVRADHYAVVAATITKAGQQVYMFQTNTSNSSQFKATTPRSNADGTKVYSGLVNQATHGGDFQGYVPVAFSLVGTKNKDITYDMNTSTVSATRADKFLTDKADKKADGTTSNFDAEYARIASLAGPVFGQGEYGDWTGTDVVNHTAYMYFFGGFANIVGGDVYGTDQIQIKQSVE